MQIHDIGARVARNQMKASILQLAIEVVAITIAQAVGQLVQCVARQIGIDDTAVAYGARGIRGPVNAVRAGA